MSAHAQVSTSLFTAAERLRLEGISQHYRSAAAEVPGLALRGVMALAAVVAVVFLEWEIIFRVFDYMAGEKDAYWSPKIMAFSAAVVVAAFHLLAMANPAHPLVRLIGRAVGFLIPTYLAGVGLLLAAMLYADGLGDIAAPGAADFFAELQGGTTGSPPGHWLEALVEHGLSPIAVLCFAIGLGGIAICNLFVAHRLLEIGTDHFTEVERRLRLVRQVRKDLSQVMQAQQRFGALMQELDQLERSWDEAGIRDAIARQVLSVIAESLLPHKSWVAERALRHNERFEQDDGIDADRIAAQIERIEAITREDVLAALQTQQ